jgi:hypothetical protein
VNRCAGLLGVAVLLASAGCQSQPTVEPYVPGLGEIMSLQQMRHTKLWLAEQAGNWDLAAYEVKELQEGFDDVLLYHPTHEESPVDPKDAIPKMVTEPLAKLSDAIGRHDATAFEEQYDAVTDACNRCHEATDFGFNKVQRPTGNPYPNQIFAPSGSEGP